VNEFKSVKFPPQGTVFDYYIDSETKQFVPWTEKIPKFELDPDMPLQVGAYLLYSLVTTIVITLIADTRYQIEKLKTFD